MGYSFGSYLAFECCRFFGMDIKHNNLTFLSLGGIPKEVLMEIALYKLDSVADFDAEFSLRFAQHDSGFGKLPLYLEELISNPATSSQFRKYIREGTAAAWLQLSFS